MIETMIEYHGAGLAAPQVHLDLRLFVAIDGTDDAHAADPIVLVNPEILPVGTDVVEDWEGALASQTFVELCRVHAKSRSARLTGRANGLNFAPSTLPHGSFSTSTTTSMVSCSSIACGRWNRWLT